MSSVVLLAMPGVHAASPSFRECRECPMMVTIPSGQFTMGTSAEEDQREGVVEGLRGRGQPQRVVKISRSFALGKYPVTRGEYAAFVAATRHETAEYCTVYSNTGRPFEWKKQSGFSWRNPNYPQTDRHPVVCVGWDDAHAYTEYAARAGSSTSRFWGNDAQQTCRYANTADKRFASRRELPTAGSLPCSDGFIYTAPVGRFRPNAFGLFDTLGNAWQWVEDCFNENLEGAPTDGSAWLSGACENRVHKGGAWTFVPSFVRTGGRMRDELERHDARGGFRVALTNGKD